MKKIIFLSIGLLFSSVQAADFNDAEILHVAVELTQNTKFFTNVCAMYQQGLTVEQIAEQLMLSNKLCL